MKQNAKAKSFTNEQIALLSFVSLKSEKCKEKFDLQQLVKESLNQGCLLALLHSACFDGEASNLSTYYIMTKSGMVLRHNQLIYNAEHEIADAFNGKIEYVILKGSSSAAYYVKPEERMTGDIDIYVKNENLDEAISILENLGYKDSEIENERHLVFFNGKVIVEIHFEIAGVPTYSNDRLKNLLAGVLDDSVKKSPFGYEIKVPGDEKQAIILLLHLRHHFYIEGIGLRHLLDWAYFVDKTANEPFWQSVLTVFNENGLLNFAKAFTKICALYLNSFLPDWANDVSNETCKKIMEEIFLSGNFGRKDDTYIDSSELMPDENGNGRQKKFFTLCHQAILGKYPFVKKWFILYPFLTVYETVRYAIKIASGKKSTVSITAKAAKRRKKLIKTIEENK